MNRLLITKQTNTVLFTCSCAVAVTELKAPQSPDFDSFYNLDCLYSLYSQNGITKSLFYFLKCIAW